MTREEYLQTTEFLDFNKKRVYKQAIDITKGLRTDKEKAVALFYWVRDQIKYNMYSYIPNNKANLKASVTLRRGNGFCMSKAVLLSTFARAVGIPARIHMIDIINHKIPKWIEEFMGTRTFHCHGYSELYFNGKWRKLTPVFDKDTAIKAGYIPTVEFDGENDALLASHDKEGNLFVEYTKDWGIYSDVPIEKIIEIFSKNYGKIYTEFQFQKPDKLESV
ncbi:MAG: transglutaminase family protein [Promethearchaeota archaeon]